VNESGQMYTIEGVTAGILLVVTTYIVLSTTSVLTIQDVHIIDLQLEQLGSDALTMMDTPYLPNSESNLSRYINTTPIGDNEFRTEFLSLLNTRPGYNADNLKFNATVYYWDSNTNSPKNFTFGNGYIYYRENAVKVSRWVYIEKTSNPSLPSEIRDGNPHSLLIEVLIWRT
jgi:hypothetical protein